MTHEPDDQLTPRPTKKGGFRALLLFVLLACGLGAAAYLVVSIFDRPAPELMRVPKKTPEELAARVVPTWERTMRSPGHSVHLKGNEPLVCSNCHEVEADVFKKPPPERCARCHVRSGPVLHESKAAKEKLECTTCHAFRELPDAVANLWDCQRCHQEPQGNKMAIAVHSKEKCSDCHRPHTTPATQPRDCIECHEKQAAHHGRRSTAGPQLCMDCHKPHQKAKAAAELCVTCHSKTDAPNVPATALFENGHKRCVDCHGPHEFTRAGAAACRSCHTDRRALAEQRSPTHAACKGCHPQHNVKSRPVGLCLSCHREVRVSHMKSAAGSCVKCHPPHSKELPGGVALPCASCHAGKRVLGDTRVEAHRECKSCHQPHNPLAGAANKCASCHEAFNPAHPSVGAKGRCVGCHPPHPKAGVTLVSTASPKGVPARPRGEPIVVACTSCHKEAKSDTARHSGGIACSQCHGAHEFRLSGAAKQALCKKCHGEQVRKTAASPGHVVCVNCHDAHSPQKKPACAGCHEKQGKSTADTGHRNCTKCHDAHLPRKPRSDCGSCHAKQLASTPAGHQQCKQCHETHAGRKLAGAKCTTCHRGRKAGPHARVKGGCTSCHRPHEPGPKGRPKCPTCHVKSDLPHRNQDCSKCHEAHGAGTALPSAKCTNCHKPDELPGLHAMTPHQICASCHKPHVKPKGDRALCTSCHLKRKDHIPTATMCTGCHTFGGKQ